MLRILGLLLLLVSVQTQAEVRELKDFREQAPTALEAKPGLDVPSQPVQDAPTKREVESGRLFQIGVYLLHNSANTMEADSVSVRSGNTRFSASAKLDLENAYGLGAEFVRPMPANRLFVSGGLSYEFPRSIKSMTISASGIVVKGNGATEKVSLFSLYANLGLALGGQYVFGGLNISRPTFSGYSGGAGSDTTLVSIADIGGQLGIGFEMGQNVMLELLYKQAAFTLQETAPNLLVEYNRVTVGGLQMQLKFVF